jgi:hypothetical protein
MTKFAYVCGLELPRITQRIEHEPAVVVLSRGRELRLETMDTVRDLSKQREIDVVWVETSEAIGEYNRLANQGVRVAALIHSTC